MIPRGTYRLQLRPGFGFAEAAASCDYLAALGVSHLYSSPVLQAAPGSTHGYDVVDPTHLSRELGGAGGFAELCHALAAHRLGQVLDVVPNHMAIGSERNRWWWDVLENGPASQYASYFDVEWVPPAFHGDNRILLPILGDHYGRVLEAGELSLAREGGKLVLRYHDHELPIAPRSLGGPLGRAAERSGSDDLAFVADHLGALPLPTATDRESTRRRHRDKEVLGRQLEWLLATDEEVAAAVDEVIEETNRDVEALDALVQQQNYRLAFWRTAGRELGYRRFFDIDSLAGVRVDDEVVFADTHALVLEQVRSGCVDGLRIDHPDGIRDPELYLRRLRDAVGPDTWIVVEKILQAGEHLPESWPVEGTTGYDFLDLAGGLFVDPAGEEPLTRFYAELTGEPTDWAEIVRDKKHVVMRDTLGSEVNRVTELMLDVCERHRRHRDYTRDELRAALREVIACFPVYRSYVRAEAGELGEQDRRHVREAVGRAREHRPDLDPELFAFLEDVLLLRVRGEAESDLVMRLQQVTGAVMAKGAEDTAFYCYNRFVALNEVGGEPGRFGIGLERFHEAMRGRAAQWPEGMLGTSTHDTKRSEDVRARLYVLSEMPGEWIGAVRGWQGRAARYESDGRPDANDTYMLFQNLVGAWPIDAERMTAYADKAAKESKRHTSWTRTDADYEAAVRRWVEGVAGDRELVASIDTFVRSIARDGYLTSLAQTLLKLTTPGVPDIYQGTELWDLSLVDPDNRRPVDFARRRRLLSELDTLSPEQVMARMDEGLPKLWLVRQGLRVRRDHPEAFRAGASYEPLRADGERAEHVVAFVRGGRAVAVAPRLVRGLGGSFGDTRLPLPPGRWHDVLTGRSHEGGTAQLDGLLDAFPVALLVSGSEEGG